MAQAGASPGFTGGIRVGVSQRCVDVFVVFRLKTSRRRPLQISLETLQTRPFPTIKAKLCFL